MQGLTIAAIFKPCIVVIVLDLRSSNKHCGQVTLTNISHSSDFFITLPKSEFAATALIIKPC